MLDALIRPSYLTETLLKKKINEGNYIIFRLI